MTGFGCSAGRQSKLYATRKLILGVAYIVMTLYFNLQPNANAPNLSIFYVCYKSNTTKSTNVKDNCSKEPAYSF